MRSENKNRTEQYEGEQMALDIYSGNPALVTEEALLKIFQDATEGSVGDSNKNQMAIANAKKNVVMGNDFIVGLEEGSRFAYKISRMAIAQIPMDADEFPLITITTDDIEQMGMTRQRLTGHAKDVLDEILSYRIVLAAFSSLQKSSKLGGINVFSSAEIIPGKGAINVRLNPLLKDHFLNLKADFTQYALPVVARMPGFATAKLHELLLSRSRKYNADLLRFNIEDLVQILNYKPKGDFKPSTFVTNVIKRAVASINEHTECNIRYKAIKTGREYSHIRFYVESGWKTLEEKKEFFALLSDEQNESQESIHLFQQAEDEIERRLKTGDGELILDAKDDFNTGKVIIDCGKQ